MAIAVAKSSCVFMQVAHHKQQELFAIYLEDTIRRKKKEASQHQESQGLKYEMFKCASGWLIAVRIFESGILYILMGTNKQTLAKTPPSNITEPNALRVENQICLHLK
uniref:Uncharacterized protein n=1 Tax=Populus trichocarpa TaxID=3694 RepID=A0A2K2ASI0_POPTR